MVKVVSRDGLKYQVECHCGRLLEYETDDIQTHYRTGLEFVKCPVCHTNVIHKEIHLVGREQK